MSGVELARRLAALDRFAWRPGMRVLPDTANKGARCVRVDGACWVFAVETDVEVEGHLGPAVECWSDDALTGEELPDLADPATLGALLALVREAWRDPDAAACPVDVRGIGRHWCVVGRGDRDLGRGDTEAEALVHALEDAGHPGVVVVLGAAVADLLEEESP